MDISDNNLVRVGELLEKSALQEVSLDGEKFHLLDGAVIELIRKCKKYPPRKKGHWIYYGMRFVAPGELRIAYMCSACKNEILLADEMKYHWKACPICDAMMEEEIR